MQRLITAALSSVLLVACGGGGSNPSEEALAPPESEAPVPAPIPPGGGSTLIAGTMEDCYRHASNNVSYYWGAIDANGTVGNNDIRVDIKPVSGGEADLYSRTDFGRDQSGSYVKLSETLEANVPTGVQRRNYKVFLPNGDVSLEKFDYVGIVPTGLEVAESKNYSITNTVRFDSLPLAPQTEQESFTDTLLSIGSLQTAGMKFPFVCEIEQRVTSINGAPASLRRLLWIAPGYGVVRVINDDPTDRLPYGFEVTEVIEAPFPS